MPWRKFIFLLIQLFFILKLFSWWERTTGLGLGAYLIVFFIVFWIINWIFGQIELGRPVSNTIIFKILPKFTFTQDWFGFLVVISTAVGFFLSRALVGSAIVTYIAVILGFILAYLYYQKGDLRHKLISLLCVAFVFGIGLGSRFTSNSIIVFLFIVANVLLYFLSEAGS